MTDEWQAVRDTLAHGGVTGADGFGTFVNDSTYLAPSRFDGRAAAPLLIELLPMLRDPRVVSAVARHLNGHITRAAGYGTVRTAFERWATEPGDPGWALADTLARAADRSKASELIGLALTRRYGVARQCIVGALWRFRSVTDVEAPLRRLITDPDVSLVAMSALHRSIGAEATKPILEQLHTTTSDPLVREQARRQLKRIEKQLAAQR